MVHKRTGGVLLLVILFLQLPQDDGSLKLNEKEYFEARGANVLVFSNWYNDLFSDSKISGVEIIHHDVRTATNGDVRLGPTPEQWDPIPKFVRREVDVDSQTIEAFLEYPAEGFSYSIKAEARDGEITLSVNLAQPMPQSLEGVAGFNLEFLPSAYFEKSYIMDNRPGLFPLYPSGPTVKGASGTVVPRPIASGRTLSLSPEDPATHVTITSRSGTLQLFDGRNKAQNGWYVVRSLLPAGKSGRVLEWRLKIHAIANWVRPPVIGFSQVGYHPRQRKTAVLELDPNDTPASDMRVLKIGEGGGKEVLVAPVKTWGKYLRYSYATADFSAVTEEGVYTLEYGGRKTGPVRIAGDVYEDGWHSTMDVFFPVQMDHMMVNETYRVWHGASHLDDALQAPVNHVHFDLYAQGPSTGTKYKPGEHIPGLNVGGWYDAGDFDIRTQSQYATVLSLARTWELFQPDRDETTVDQATRFVDIHHPDGRPDILQQIEHGTLQLVAQHNAVGHAIPGIVEAHLHQYTHLGDGVTKTDNLVYNPSLDSLQTSGKTSGTFDDRWAFTTRITALNYGSVAALAAASRVLRGFNDSLALQCLAIARRVWKEEHSREPSMFRHGNTTGGDPKDEELSAAVELLLTTKEEHYGSRIMEMWPHIEEHFGRTGVSVIRAIPFMGKDWKEKIEPLARKHKEQADELYRQNPYGVPISTGGWGGNGWVVGFSTLNYYLTKAFPEIIGPDYTLRGLHYLYGCHPGSAVSFVSAVGARSKKTAYGNNRADYSFIAGGVVPGILIIKPDFPENKEDWPFLWGENEYVIGIAANYVFLVQAANDLVGGRTKND